METDAIAEAMIGRMHEMFGLEGDEETRLKEIIHRNMQGVEGIRKGSFKEIRGVFRKMNGELGEVLGPERHNQRNDDRDKRFGRKRRHKDDPDE